MIAAPPSPVRQSNRISAECFSGARDRVACTIRPGSVADGADGQRPFAITGTHDRLVVATGLFDLSKESQALLGRGLRGQTKVEQHDIGAYAHGRRSTLLQHRGLPPVQIHHRASNTTT